MNNINLLLSLVGIAAAFAGFFFAMKAAYSDKYLKWNTCAVSCVVVSVGLMYIVF